MSPASYWERDATGARVEQIPCISQAASSLIAFFAISAVLWLFIFVAIYIDTHTVPPTSSPKQRENQADRAAFPILMVSAEPATMLPAVGNGIHWELEF